MRWLTPIILIVVLLTAACGHDPGGKDKIAVIDWDKAFSAHPKQTVLKQGEAELQKLLRYREEQAEIAKTQIAGLTRLQQLKQNSKANFLDAGFQTQMYAAEAKERKKLLDAYDAAVKEAGYDSMDAAAEAGTAFVFMGHGTSHTANITYDQMQTQMEQLGYENVFIGTVEGEPEDTACEAVIEKLKNAGYKKVILRPLMVVAGDHANNDMAGDDDDSWKSQFEASGVFDSIDTQIAGLGEIDAIQQLYVAHTQAAIDAE